MSSPRPPKRSLDDAALVEATPRPSKRSLSFPGVIPISQHHDRQISEGGLVNSSSELRHDIPPIENLPQELLLQVFSHLVHPSLLTAGFPDKRVKHYSDQSNGEDGLDNDGFGSAVDRKDLRNVCLVSRTFKTVATTVLYRCAHLATVKSPESLLLTLTAHPDLQPLVKHISIPTYAGRSTVRFDYAFTHDWLKYEKLDDEVEEFPHGNMFAECSEAIEGSVLKHLMPLLPNLKTLIIPQISFYEGPIIDDLVLPNLTTLRITLMSPPEDIFKRFSFCDSLRTVIGLRPEVLGHAFPALQRLEVCTATGTWEADLVSGEGEADKCGCPMKYFESLKTAATSQIAPAEWHLITLERPIFDSSYLQSLVFDGPGSECSMPCEVARMVDWDLNRFLSETGSGLRTLSLDWEVHHRNHRMGDDTQQSYFGPSRHLIKLPQLTNLTHLTVSLQALFGHANMFWDWVDDMEASPDTELAKLLPPSLRVLRIAEYILGMYEYGYGADVPEDDGEPDYVYHGRCVLSFLQALRAWWLTRDEGRELWLRRRADLDVLAVNWGDSLSWDGLGYILDFGVWDEGFQRILRPFEDNGWDPEGDDGGVDREDEETTENEDDDPDGGSD
ncbi:hypothetical protein INS49_009992 [Diaporthe citri]|uniref:uncharacterized protein n=1 Tax=Diaporthe citri TaxID=83186 RepID=UPI001C806CA0|nr:uncharacterized protein INS49_009992 [Diaporthe citri]KAG6361764.1 hypothetical protein INS49_009992 [Diaporthe citri]